MTFQTFFEAKWSGLGNPEESLTFRQFSDWYKVISLVGFVWANISSYSLNTGLESTCLISIALPYRSLGRLHLLRQETEVFPFPWTGQYLHYWYKEALLPILVRWVLESCLYSASLIYQVENMELYLLIILALSLYSEAIPIKDLGIPGTVNDKKVKIIMILDVVNITA